MKKNWLVLIIIVAASYRGTLPTTHSPKLTCILEDETPESSPSSSLVTSPVVEPAVSQRLQSIMSIQAFTGKETLFWNLYLTLVAGSASMPNYQTARTIFEKALDAQKPPFTGIPRQPLTHEQRYAVLKQALEVAVKLTATTITKAQTCKQQASLPELSDALQLAIAANNALTIQTLTDEEACKRIYRAASKLSRSPDDVEAQNMLTQATTCLHHATSSTLVQHALTRTSQR